MSFHRVRPGDRLSTIAALHGVGTADIVAMNQHKPLARLQSGAVVFASLEAGEDIALPGTVGASLGGTRPCPPGQIGTGQGRCAVLLDDPYAIYLEVQAGSPITALVAYSPTTWAASEMHGNAPVENMLIGASQPDPSVWIAYGNKNLATLHVKRIIKGLPAGKKLAFVRNKDGSQKLVLTNMPQAMGTMAGAPGTLGMPFTFCPGGMTCNHGVCVGSNGKPTRLACQWIRPERLPTPGVAGPLPDALHRPRPQRLPTPGVAGPPQKTQPSTCPPGMMRVASKIKGKTTCVPWRHATPGVSGPGMVGYEQPLFEGAPCQPGYIRDSFGACVLEPGGGGGYDQTDDNPTSDMTWQHDRNVNQSYDPTDPTDPNYDPNADPNSPSYDPNYDPSQKKSDAQRRAEILAAEAPDAASQVPLPPWDLAQLPDCPMPGFVRDAFAACRDPKDGRAMAW